MSHEKIKARITLASAELSAISNQSKQFGPKGALRCPLRVLQWSFPFAAVCWSHGFYEIPNSKHQVSGFQVSGVRCQGKKTKKLKPPAILIFTGKAIELCIGPKDQVFDVE